MLLKGNDRSCVNNFYTRIKIYFLNSILILLMKYINVEQIFQASEVSCINTSRSLGRIQSASLSWEKHAAGHVRDEKRPDERGRVEAGPASCDAACETLRCVLRTDGPVSSLFLRVYVF